jgi:RIO kinase 1
MRSSKERFKTLHGIFDAFTIKTLQSLSSKQMFELDTLSPISEGKEAYVLSALREIREERVALKVYFLQTADFNKMYYYIKDDPRFASLIKKRRKVIMAWASREHKNLHIAREAGILSPTPYIVKNNVLIMQFIGKEDGKPCPLLTNVSFSDFNEKEKENFFRECFRSIGKLRKHDLVHGDLSSFNVLVKDDAPVFIDFSHATPYSCHMGKQLYERDLKNMFQYFNKHRYGSFEEAKKIADKE